MESAKLLQSNLLKVRFVILSSQTTIDSFNIFIWDWNKDNIERVTKELTAINGNIEVRTSHKDLSAGNSIEFYRELYEEVQDLDVSILVNNVGASSYKNFDDLTPKNVSDILKLNLMTPTMLTYLFISKLKERKNRSAILNVSCISGVVPLSSMALGTSAKAFNRYLSLGLTEEYRDKIDIQTICPTIVHTDSTKGYPYPDGVQPDAAAAYVLKKLGVVEETSVSLIGDISIYGILSPLYNASFHVWQLFLEHGYKPILLKLREANKR